jgi:hypothetical protein
VREGQSRGRVVPGKRGCLSGGDVVCTSFMHALLLGLPKATYLVGKREEYAPREWRKRREDRLDRDL